MPSRRASTRRSAPLAWRAWFAARARVRLFSSPACFRSCSSLGTLLVGEALRAQLVERPFGLSQLEAHSLEHALALAELDLVVLDDLDAVATRVADVEEAARESSQACILERAPHGLLVVDDEPEMLLLRSRAALEQRDELIAQTKERRAGHAAVDPRRLEDPCVERDRLVDVVDLQGDMVDPDETRLHDATMRPPAARCLGCGSGRADFRP